MSEMSESSVDIGSSGEPFGAGQPSEARGQTAGAPERPEPGKASAPAGGGPPPAAGVGRPAEPGKASAPAGPPGPGGGENPGERPGGEGLDLDYLFTDVAFPRGKRQNQAGDDAR
jgi:hypothetical protein